MSQGWKFVARWLVPTLVLLLGLEYLLRPTTRQRNYEVFTEMAYSKAFESLSPSAHLQDGSTQQAVPEGVVIRGQLPFHYGTGPEEALRAGLELSNPHGDEPDVLARGALLYGRFCVICHGADGAGLGPVVLRGMLPPPSMQAVRALQMTDGEMFHILTLGQGNMASYAAQVGADDRWKVIRHVRALQEAAQ